MAGYVITVDFHLKPESSDKFLSLVRENAALSLANETGCRRFDVCVPLDGSHSVFLYEIYDDEAAFKTHLQMPHYKSFAAATAAMVQDRKIVPLELVGEE